MEYFLLLLLLYIYIYIYSIYSCYFKSSVDLYKKKNPKKKKKKERNMRAFKGLLAKKASSGKLDGSGAGKRRYMYI